MTANVLASEAARGHAALHPPRHGIELFVAVGAVPHPLDLDRLREEVGIAALALGQELLPPGIRATGVAIGPGTVSGVDDLQERPVLLGHDGGAGLNLLAVDVAIEPPAKRSRRVAFLDMEEDAQDALARSVVEAEAAQPISAFSRETEASVVVAQGVDHRRSERRYGRIAGVDRHRHLLHISHE